MVSIEKRVLFYIVYFILMFIRTVWLEETANNMSLITGIMYIVFMLFILFEIGVMVYKIIKS